MAKKTPVAPIVPPPAVITFPAFVAVSATPPPPDSPPPPPDSVAGKVLASVRSAGSRLETATADIVATGNDIHDILLTAKEKGTEWDANAFDRIIKLWNDTFRAENPLATVAPDAVRYWQVSRAVAAVITLGVADPDRVAVKRYMLMFGPAFNTDKSAITMTIRTGWAEWLKVAVPLNVSGPGSMTADTLAESLSGQVSALHAFDPTLYPKPKPPKNTAKRRKSGGGGGGSRKPSPPAQPPAPGSGGTATPPPVPPPGKSGSATPPPAGPDAVPPPAPNVFANLVSAMTGGDAKTRLNMATAIGAAVLKSGDDEAIYALYNAIKADVHRIREARKSAKVGTKTA